MDYSERNIKSVTISGLLLQGDRVSADVGIGMEALDNPSQFGPRVSLTVIVPSHGEQTLQEIESEILAAATSLLERLSDLSKDGLSDAKLAWEAEMREPVQIDLAS